MINSINNFNYNIYTDRNFSASLNYKSGIKPFKQLNADTVTFTGMSPASKYKSVFDYLAADILNKNKKYQVDGSMLSASNIRDAVTDLFKLKRVYGPCTISIPAKIKWKPYVPDDIRVGSVNKINDARAERLEKWHRFLEFPDCKDQPELKSLLEKDKSLRFVIWNAINSELKNNNRHIPVPLNLEALYKTVSGFYKITPEDRAVRCASPSFLDLYTHRLRDTLLEKKGLSDNTSLWVRIPSLKKDSVHNAENISMVEILSNRNWCTRSSVDKAEDALKDGDFFIYLERDKQNKWKPLVGMASHEGKIDQIQGPENNNIIPTAELKNILKYLKENNLKCRSGIVSEGPKAYQQLLISKKLAEYNADLGLTLEKAIKENDDFAVLKFMNKNVEKLPDGKLEIDSYKPSYNADKNSGLTIPYSMMGINEDAILKNVEKINGNLILSNKNYLYNSTITEFPPALKEVKGTVICSDEQFAKFGDDIKRVAKKYRVQEQ